jgi:membrane protease subunit HflK
MSDHHHHDHDHGQPPTPPAPETRDAASQALSEALGSSFTIVKYAMVLLVLVILWAGIFTVKPGEKAVRLRFGHPLGEGQKMLLNPGKIYWSFPYPIDEVVRIPIAEIQKVVSTAGWYAMTHDQEVAYETLGTEPPPSGAGLNPLFDGYVLTADQNVIHTRATVFYRIDDPLAAIFNFAAGTNQQFNVAGISNAVQNAANNALVATAARFNVDDILTRNIAGFQDAVRQRLDDLVEREHLGVVIDQCQVQSAAPRQLADVFRQVTAARQNRDKLVQDALGEQNRILSQAGAQAASITNFAESARTRYVTSIQSDAEAFTKLLPQYQSNPRLYAQLELAKAMPQILANVQKDFLPQRPDGKARELRLMLNREPPQPRSAANP